jgi:hypothetical protein
MNDDEIISKTSPQYGWVPGCFQDNRNKVPWEHQVPYEGQYVAWNLNGTRIIAGADSEEALFAKMDALGYPSAGYVMSYVDPPI